MMTEDQPEVATKAPESDAPAPASSGAPDASSSDHATASMGEHCVTDRPTPSGAKPQGEISKISDVEVYVSKPDEYPHSPAKLLLLLSSGTGVHSTNNKLQADAFAAEGFVVIMPDQFGGDPAPNSNDPNLPSTEDTATVIEQVKLKAVETVQSFRLDMWLARQTPAKVLPLLHKVLTGVREEFADALAYGGGVYAAGYCFGAKYVLLLGAGAPTDPAAVGETTTGEGNEDPAAAAAKGGDEAPTTAIKAGALAHGTMITREDLQGMAAPVSMVCVDDDQLFPDEVREAGAQALQTNGVKHEVRMYSGMPHGFAVVGEYEDSKIRAKQKQAFTQMLEWLQTH